VPDPGPGCRMPVFCAISHPNKLPGYFFLKTGILTKERFKQRISSGVGTISTAEFFRNYVLKFLRRRMIRGDLPSPPPRSQGGTCPGGPRALPPVPSFPSLKTGYSRGCQSGHAAAPDCPFRHPIPGIICKNTPFSCKCFGNTPVS